MQKLLTIFLLLIQLSLIEAAPCIECYAEQCISDFNKGVVEAEENHKEIIKSANETGDQNLKEQMFELAEDNKRAMIIMYYTKLKDCINGLNPM